MSLLWIFLTALVTGIGTHFAKKLVASEPSYNAELERVHTKETWKTTDPDGTKHEYTRETVKDSVKLPDDTMIPYVIHDTDPNQKRLQ